MRRIFFLLILNSFNVFAQKQATHWVFGPNGGVDFTCSPPQLEVSAFDGLEGGASISDGNGRLLFYTNGNSVWNRNYRIMPNGKGIGGLCMDYDSYPSSSQSSIIIPYPGHSDLYYIFTTDCAEDNFVNGLRYSLVDISLQGGLGDITIKNQPLIAPTAEKIAAVFHQNGNDVWLVTHGVNSNSFYSYLISNSGLDVTPVVSNTGQIHTGGRGYLKFSPDGKKMVAVSFIFGGEDGIQPELFHFDNLSGIVTSDYVLSGIFKSIYAASFSPDGNVLYLSCSWSCGGVIEQFDLQAGTPQQILDSRFGVTDPNVQVMGALQLGIDGKLYFLNFLVGVGKRQVGVIHHPNLLGASCLLQNDLLAIPCSMDAFWGLPNFIESYFQTVTAPALNCLPNNTSIVESVDFSFLINCNGKTVEFFDSTQFKNIEMEMITMRPPVISGTWDFGDGSMINFQTGMNPIHVYDKPGKYSVMLRVGGYGCDPILKEKEIYVNPLLAQFDYDAACSNFTIQFENTTTSLQNVNWHWNFGDNSTDSVSNMASPSHIYATPGSYNVKLSAENGCMTSVVKNSIEVYELLNFSLGQDTAFCFDTPLVLAGPDKTNAHYRWSNGSAGKDLTIQFEGTYWLTISRSQCVFSDTVTVSYQDCEFCKTINSFSLGSDDAICPGDTLTITGPDFFNADFLWSNGLTEKKINVIRPGTVWLRVTRGKCDTTDTLTVRNKDCEFCHVYPDSFSLGNDTTICQGDELSLKSPDLPNAVFVWNTASNQNTIRISQAGQYWVQAIFGDCFLADTLVVHTLDCPACTITVPNVFTPGSDGLNDTFMFPSNCLSLTYQLDIYNRWGEIVFETSDQKGWDGKFRGQDADAEIYFFSMRYSFLSSGNEKISGIKRGWVSLVR